MNLFEKDITLTITGDKRAVQKNYRFLWAKYVKGFYPQYHCAKSLKGNYTKQLGLTPVFGKPIYFNETDSWDYIYLCGVNYKGYEFNFHFPVKYSEGKECRKLDQAGLLYVFENAEELEIPALPAGFKELPYSYTSCRNYQFGYHYYAKDSDIDELSFT